MTLGLFLTAVLFTGFGMIGFGAIAASGNLTNRRVVIPFSGAWLTATVIAYLILGVVV